MATNKISVRIPHSIKQEIDKETQKRGITLTDFVNDAIIQALQQNTTRQETPCNEYITEAVEKYHERGYLTVGYVKLNSKRAGIPEDQFMKKLLENGITSILEV